MEFHHPIMSKLRDIRDQTYRQTDRHTDRQTGVNYNYFAVMENG